MHDRLDSFHMNEDESLGAALRALPASAPDCDAWPALSALVRHRRSVRRTVWYTLPAAFGCAIALAFAWPHVHLRAPLPPPQRTVSQPARANARPAAPDISALQASSTEWQAWVQNLDRNGGPLDGRRLAQAVSLQDRIGLVDLQLSTARAPTTVADLWQQRITLLQQLGLLHLQPYRIAEQATPDRAGAIPM